MFWASRLQVWVSITATCLWLQLQVTSTQCHKGPKWLDGATMVPTLSSQQLLLDLRFWDSQESHLGLFMNFSKLFCSLLITGLTAILILPGAGLCLLGASVWRSAWTFSLLFYQCGTHLERMYCPEWQ